MVFVAGNLSQLAAAKLHVTVIILLSDQIGVEISSKIVLYLLATCYRGERTMNNRQKIVGEQQRIFDSELIRGYCRLQVKLKKFIILCLAQGKSGYVKPLPPPSATYAIFRNNMSLFQIVHLAARHCCSVKYYSHMIENL